MAIYGFGILSGYVTSGVDSAQGLRARFLRDKGIDIKYIFLARPDIAMPWMDTLQDYLRAGISLEQMVTPYHILSGQSSLQFTVKIEDVLARLKGLLAYTREERSMDHVHLYREEEKVAEIIPWDEEMVYRVSYFNHGTIYMSEFYTDSLFYTEYQNAGTYRRVFTDSKGVVLYDEVFKDGKIEYRFADGEVTDVTGFWRKVIAKLELSAEDVCVLDRPGYIEYQAPLFELHGQSKIYAVLHSDHYYKVHENRGSVYMNYEYYYWFKYSKDIDRFIVSTDEQRDVLFDTLKKYKCSVPRIEVIPPGILKEIIPMEEIFANKNRMGIVTVSRVESGKQVDMVVRSVAKAHEKLSEIDLHIYGYGFEEDVKALNDLIQQLNAVDYVHYMGHQDVSRVYMENALYISASVNETFGLTLLEAQCGGCALLGLDVRYGNRLFIHPGENGYLVDFDVERDWDRREQVAEEMAERIVEIMSDEQKLRRFQERSYELALEFQEDNAFERWAEILG